METKAYKRGTGKEKATPVSYQLRFDLAPNWRFMGIIQSATELNNLLVQLIIAATIGLRLKSVENRRTSEAFRPKNGSERISIIACEGMI